jgi:nitrogen regulatory protein PII 2
MSDEQGSAEALRMRWALRQELSGPHAAAPGALKPWSVPPEEHPVALKEVIAIIRPQRWIATKARVQRLRLQAFTQQRVLGRGRERGLRYLPRQGATPGMGVRYLPKRLISWIVEAHHVEPLVEAIIEANRTGHLGDGRIFVLPVEAAVRIRTGDRDRDALRGQMAFEVVRGAPHEAAPSTEVAHAAG